MFDNANLFITPKDGKYVLKTQDGTVISVFDTSKEAARYAFLNGAYSVRFDYDLSKDSGHTV